MPPPRLFRLFLVGPVLALVACNGQAPSATPSASPSSTPTPAASVTPSPSPSPSPSPTPGPTFRDDFDGSTLAPDDWRLFERGGSATLVDGGVELAAPPNAPAYPTLATARDVIPPAGPFYFEFGYQILSGGQAVNFNLDYAAPATADDAGVATPLLRMGLGQSGGLGMNFVTESAQPAYALPKTSWSGGLAHRIRVECDAAGRYRAIYDQEEVGTFVSQRRPRRFWVGYYPSVAIKPAAWVRLRFGYVAGGVLTSPDPARPKAASASP